jgi:hypothetical protein
MPSLQVISSSHQPVRGKIVPIRRVTTCVVLLLGIVCLAEAASNPVPSIDRPLLPGRSTPGTSGFLLTVRGTGFVPGAVVSWNDQPLKTTFVNGQQLTAKVLAAAVATPGTAAVTVTNPGPGGGASNIALYEVTWQTPGTILFERRTEIGATNDALVAGDFNRDGKLDLVAGTGTSIAVLLGNGDGTFQVTSLATTAQSVGAFAVGDFNHDGKLDLAFPDAKQNLLYLLLGNGNGTFTEISTTIVGTRPVAEVAGDFNADGNLDLAVVNGGGSLSILLGKGDGTFLKKPPLVKVGVRPTTATAGDFNGDGTVDLAVVNSGSNNVSILLGNGDGTFALKTSPAVEVSPWGVVASDFNGDGKLDLAVTNSCGSTGCATSYGSLSILLGVGDGTFSVSTMTLEATQKPMGIAAGDFNGDRKMDLAVALQGINSAFVLAGDGRGHFAMASNPTTAAGPQSVVAGDFNGDGRLDFAVSNTMAFGVTAVSIEQQSPVAFIPALLNFPAQTVGTTSAPKIMKIMNVARPTLHISKVQVLGHYAGTCDCPATLEVGQACTATISFAPIFKGLTGGIVQVTDDAPGVVQNGILSGRGK